MQRMQSTLPRPPARRAPQSQRRPGRRPALAAALALAGLLAPAAATAQVANNPGTGDTGFFTFRPADGIGGTQINVASGNALVRTRDLADGPLTYHVVVDRAYNSLAPSDFSIVSPRWKLDVAPDTKVTVESNQDATVAGPSGYRLRFARETDGSYVAPDDFDGSLTKTVNGWTLARTSQGDEFGFDNNGTLTWTKDSQLRDFTVQGTSAAGRTILSSYGTNSGRRVNLSYNGDSLMRLMDDPASGHHAYRYAGGRLTEYESPLGQITTYGYDSNGFLDEIIEPGGTTVELDVMPSGKINAITTTLPGGVPQATSFVYTRRAYKSDVTAPDMTRRTYAYNDDWRVTRHYDPDVKPAVAASGELRDLAGWYVGPNRTYALQIAADQPDGAGLRRLTVEHEDGGEVVGEDVPCSTTPFDLVCPTSHSTSLNVSFADFTQGVHGLRVGALDDEEHHVTSDAWGYVVDKTAPSAPSEFEVEALDALTSTALITWMPGIDPDIEEDLAGSQTDGALYRVNRAGTWSGWTQIEDDGIRLQSAMLGEQVAIEVRSLDAVGNIGPVGSALLTVEQPEDEADGDPTGTGDHDLRVIVRREMDDEFDPVVGNLVTATSDERVITARTDDNGVALFPKIEHGEYRVKLLTGDDDGEDVTIEGSADQELVYTIRPRRASRAGNPIEDTERMFSLLGDYRVWCATGQFKDVDTPGIPGLLLCRSWAEDAQLALYLEQRLYDHRGAQDSTRANAFRHMVWNALMVNSTIQRFDHNPSTARMEQSLVLSTDVYEYDGRRTSDASDARASTMDRHNNRVGWGYMTRRTPPLMGGKHIPDFGVCKRIRRLVGSVQKATYKTGTGRFSRTFNNYRPVYNKELDTAGFRVKLKPQTPTFDPCGPLKPGRTG